MQSVNGAQILNITFLFLLFAGSAADDMSGTVTVTLKSVYTSL